MIKLARVVLNDRACYRWRAAPGYSFICPLQGELIEWEWHNPNPPTGKPIELSVWRNPDNTIGMTKGIDPTWVGNTLRQKCYHLLQQWGHSQHLLPLFSHDFEQERLKQLLGPHGKTLFEIFLIQSGRKG